MAMTMPKKRLNGMPAESEGTAERTDGDSAHSAVWPLQEGGGICD
jgi:hypothetical protein